MPSQVEVRALCNYIGAASYFLSRDFWTGHSPPQFPCIHIKFAARCVEGGQPAAARGQGRCQRAWKPGSSFPERELTNWNNQQLCKRNYYRLNLLEMCKALLIFRIPFYTHVLIRMGFYRRIYRDSVVLSTKSPHLRAMYFWFCCFSLQKARRSALHRDCSLPWQLHPGTIRPSQADSAWEPLWPQMKFPNTMTEWEMLQVTREILLNILSTEYSVPRDFLSYKPMLSCWELTSHSQNQSLCVGGNTTL